MNEDKITQYRFREEMAKLAENCTTLKPETAKRKARALYDKYEEIMSYDHSQKIYYKDKYDQLLLMYNALKSGKVNYSRGDVVGVLFLNDIVKVEKMGDGAVEIYLKGTEKVILSKDFSFVYEVFSKTQIGW